MVETLEVDMKLHALYSVDGSYYPAVVISISTSTKRTKAPVKVSFLGYGEEEWKSVSELRSKRLPTLWANSTTMVKVTTTAKANADKSKSIDLSCVLAAPGPGQNMTSAKLWKQWEEQGPCVVFEFYGHSLGNGEAASFSNFYDQSETPFVFEVPAKCCAIELSQDERTVSCGFSEKAIMLCKAAAMGDRSGYLRIARCRDPSEAKALGRQVEGFNDSVWDRIVCSVAFQVVFQKFSKTPKLQRALLATGDCVIAEATRNDVNWGIGIDRGDPRCTMPSQWRGCNILGWALMETRSALRASGCDESSEGELMS